MIKAMKIIPSLFSAFGIGASAAGAGATTAATGVTLFGKAIKFSFPLVAALSTAIVALVALAPKVSDFFKDITGDFEYATEQYRESTAALEENEQKIAELKETSWRDWTPELEEELRTLQEENEELKKNQEYWANRLGETSAGDENAYTLNTTGYKIYKNTIGRHGGIEQDVLGQGRTQKEALADYRSIYGDFDDEAVDSMIEKLKELGYTIEETDIQVELSAEEMADYGRTLGADLVQQLNKAITSGEASEETLRGLATQVNSFVEQMQPLYDSLQAILDSGGELPDWANGFMQTFEAVSNSVGVFGELEDATLAANEALTWTQQEYDALIRKCPGLANAVKEVNGSFQLEIDTLVSAIATGEDWAIALINNNEQVTASVIAQVKARIKAYQLELDAMRPLVRTGEATGADYMALLQGRHEQNMTLLELEKASKKFAGTSTIGASGGGSSGRSSSIDKETDAIKAQNEALEAQLALLDDRAWFLEKDLPDDPAKSEASLAQYKSIQNQRIEIYKEAQAEIHALAEAFREQGLDEEDENLRELGKLWHEYQDKIEDVYDAIEDAAEDAADRAEEAWRESLESQIEQLEKQQDVYEKFFSYMGNRIQDEIDALEKQRDEEEAYWDAKIDALETQNDAIERQIQLEQLQSALAAAKQSKVMVYKDGKFQYMEDIDAISEAQLDLESYQREEALRQEVENLERLKEQALASIDEQIAGWEEYKEEWTSVVDHYQEEQDRLLIEQELGIELEGELWRERLDNLADYVAEYQSLMSQLSMAQSALNEGYGSSGGGGGGGGGGGHSSWGSGTGVGSSHKYDGTIDMSGYPSKPSQDISDSAWKDYVDSTSGKGSSSSSSSSGSGVTNSDGSWSPYPGGPRYASGTLSAKGGISLVGEDGPELRVLNKQDGILPADITANLWDWGTMKPSDLISSISGLSVSGGKSLIIKIGQFTANLPNVKDGEDFALYLEQNLAREVVQQQGI